jgi:hypothetical protein
MRRYVISSVIFALCAVQSFGALAAGDIAVVAYNARNPDDFAWVALTEIPSNTTLNFTDASVYTNGNFRWVEHFTSLQNGPLTWTHSSNVVSGTVIRFDAVTTNWSVGVCSGGRPGLSEGGDQLFVYTGSITNDESDASWSGNPGTAVLLFGLNYGESSWTNQDLGNSVSDIPSGLSIGANTAVHVGDHKNAYYSGTLSGTPAQIRARIANSSNWTGSGTHIDVSNWPSAFHVLQEVPLFEFSRLGISLNLPRLAGRGARPGPAQVRREGT